jgi:hypothetical protein
MPPDSSSRDPVVPASHLVVEGYAAGVIATAPKRSRAVVLRLVASKCDPYLGDLSGSNNFQYGQGRDS